MSQLTNCHRPSGEALEYRPPGAVGKSGPRIGGFASNHNW